MPLCKKYLLGVLLWTNEDKCSPSIDETKQPNLQPSFRNLKEPKTCEHALWVVCYSFQWCIDLLSEPKVRCVSCVLSYGCQT